MIKLCIFDLDGTLINSIEDLADSGNFALSEMGYPIHPVDAYKIFVGNGIPKLIERITPENHRNPETLSEIHRLFSERYKIHCLDKTKPYDGILKLIDYCKENDIKTAVLSNKADNFAKFIVSEVFIENTFDFVMGQREDIAKKPAPDGVIKILDLFSVSEEETVLMGDSDVDIITAKNAKIHSIGAAWGFRGKQELVDAGAEYTSDTPTECIDILKNF